MEFCPNCGKRLISKPKMVERQSTLLLSCPKCGLKKQAPPVIAAQKVREQDLRERVIVLGKKLQQLQTLPKLRVDCPKCGNKFAYAWMVHINRLEKSSTQFFRCTKCNYTFRNDD